MSEMELAKVFILYRSTPHLRNHGPFKVSPMRVLLSLPLEEILGKYCIFFGDAIIFNFF